MPAREKKAAMLMAIEEGWLAAGVSTPNPPVGCVILDSSGNLVGRGSTSAIGGPHAEVNALSQAGASARGGTAVVTLEPCAHFGKTPPCTRAIIDAGIAHVIYAISDPNSIAAGGSIILKEKGVQVEGGFMEAEAKKGSLEPWLHSQSVGRPFVSLKYAATLDGKIAAADGSSKWVTNEASRADVQLWRARSDAIVIGTNTAILDNPRLTLRNRDETLAKRQLLRVVVGKRSIPDHFNLHDDTAETVFIHDHDPMNAIRALHKRDVQHIYLEGGHTIAAAFLRAGLVDRLFIYLAPKFLGQGTAAVGDLGIGTIADALKLQITDVTSLVSGHETDIRLIGYFNCESTGL